MTDPLFDFVVNHLVVIANVTWIERNEAKLEETAKKMRKPTIPCHGRLSLVTARRFHNWLHCYKHEYIPHNRSCYTRVKFEFRTFRVSQVHQRSYDWQLEHLPARVGAGENRLSAVSSLIEPDDVPASSYTRRVMNDVEKQS